MANGGDKGGTWNVMQAIVGCSCIFGLFGVFGALIMIILMADTTKLDAGIMAILNILVGVVATIAVAVVNFYFGSSKSSADKEETAKMATASAVEAATATSAALEKTSATLDKMVTVTGTGSGTSVPIVNNGKPVSATIDGDVTLTPTPTNRSQTTREQLIERAGEKFSSGEYDEARFRATLKAPEIALSDPEVDAAVEKYKPGGG